MDVSLGLGQNVYYNISCNGRTHSWTLCAVHLQSDILSLDNFKVKMWIFTEDAKCPVINQKLIIHIKINKFICLMNIHSCLPL